MKSQSPLQGQDATKNNQLAGQPTIPNKQIQPLKLMLEVTPHWMMHQLAVEVGISYFSVQHIIKDFVRMKKIASCLVPHHLTKAQRLYMDAIDNLNLEQYEMKVMYFCTILKPLIKHLSIGL
jgi:hypothetical protein